MKKTILMLLTIALCVSLCACGAAQAPADSVPSVPVSATDKPAASGTPETPETPAASVAVTFTDSCGREVELPGEITRIAPSGTVATMFLAVIAPEKLVCLGSEIQEEQRAYLPEGLSELPVTGQLYGGKGTLNKEALLAAGPQIIIDFGDMKKSVTEDMDALQEQVGIPCIFIESDLGHMAEAFRRMGALLPGKEAHCEALAAYVEETLTLAEENIARIPETERVRAMYTSGADGLGTNAKGSSQAQVLDIVGVENAIEVENVNHKGGGNLINMEQLFTAAPEVVLFTADSIYDTVAQDSAWSQLEAIQRGSYYEIPATPYNWLGSPPSLNMLLGIRWLGNLLYPEVYDVDMVAETQRAYRLLWGYEMSPEEARSLLAHSTLK